MKKTLLSLGNHPYHCEENCYDREGIVMKCEKSRKRELLRCWGIKELGKARPFADVTKDMRSMMRWRLGDILAFIDNGGK